ncbi:LysE family translocator [Corynebacterium aquatimens]|uniref:LysE family translocator n=1 Tax=Corynebacterium stercoris TaxID=2943490 RepID=A0ABT1G684_9CORY|nr:MULTISPECIES: LysE family translocator [Corynebacterium]MCP1388573.1 LysE family translocator [Corynebacterium stercoris]QYH19810.1 LysE family translocator [Corynebacterium aquatimens]UIZ93056.1 LysE family translocator [Corynebacterium sp. CNCTC7651]
MLLTDFLALIGVFAAAVAVPGPDVVQIIRFSVKSRAAGVACATGIMAGYAIWIAASLLGLSALMQAAPQLLAVLQLVGGAYLIYMGVGAVRSGFKAWGSGTSTMPADAKGESHAASQAFRVGMATNLSNPKSVLFFGAVFAQFVKPEMGWEWFAIILLSLVLIGFIMSAGFALLVDVFAGFLDRYGYLVDIITGTIFVVLAMWMIRDGVIGLGAFVN